MNTIIRLISAFMMILSVYGMAMDAIMKKVGCYEYSQEQFPIKFKKQGNKKENTSTTAHILTFYPKGADNEVAYLDYEVDKETQSACIRMFVCDETDEVAKEYFFLVLDHFIREKHKIKNISGFIRGNEVEFYKRFGASNYTLKGDLYMKLPSNGMAYFNLDDYYRKNPPQNIESTNS